VIIHTHQKSKKRKPSAKERELVAEWNAIVNKYTMKTTKPTSKHNKNDKYMPKAVSNYRKNDIPSRDTGYYNTFRKPDQFYTGSNMVGIGTLHKSNAVPIFTEEEAKDQATMRR
jgi:hypothetical protein